MRRILFLLIIALLINHIEEPQLIHALARRHNTQPIPKLLLLQELLGPAPTLATTP